MLRRPEIETSRRRLWLVGLEGALPLELFLELFVLEEQQETSLIFFLEVLGQLASVVGVVTGFAIGLIISLFALSIQVFGGGTKLVNFLEGESLGRKDVPRLRGFGFGREEVQGQ